MDMLDNTPPDEAQDNLRIAMIAQYAHDAAVIKKQGRIPDWYGEPRPLDKSLARVLNYAYENGPFEWTERATANNRKLTAAFGFRSPINAHEAVISCHNQGLLKYDDGVYYMSEHGEYALEEWHLEAEVSGMDVCNALADVKDEWDVDDEFMRMWSK